MTEKSLFWGGTTVGDHGPYSDDQFSDFIRDIFQTDPATTGVVYGAGNNLNVTSSLTGIFVDTGTALVDGKLYVNDAALAIALANPGSGINHYTIVLKKDFSAQTVRAVALGPDLSAFPSVVQTDGTVWDLAIASVEVNPAGAKTIVITAGYVGMNSLVDSIANIAEAAAAPIKHRKGDTGNWGENYGLTNFDTSAIPQIMQAGCVEVTASGDVVLTFPVPFSAAPIVVATSGNEPSTGVFIVANNVTATNCHLSAWMSSIVRANSFYTNWIAVGPA